ncbi:DUF6292 family protein [Streptomyces sp. NPDC058394]|uniref:DUF6292 family protein n=1 Tax=unclassified Streptomyces TaxID=2593676 RepID=UPI003653FC18
MAVAEAQLRTRRARPYLQQVADALAEAGVAEPIQVEVRRFGDEHLAAAVPLTAGQPSPVLVWDERCGWCTATSRRHPIDEDTGSAPEGEGIRYFGSSVRPEPAGLLETLAEDRKGSMRHKASSG